MGFYVLLFPLGERTCHKLASWAGGWVLEFYAVLLPCKTVRPVSTMFEPGHALCVCVGPSLLVST